MDEVSVLVDLRGVLGGLVTGLLRDRYGEAAVHEGLRDELVGPRPTVVVLSDRSVVPPRFARLLADNPGVRLLIVADDGRSGSLWRRTPLGELSVDTLLAAIDAELRRDE